MSFDALSLALIKTFPPAPCCWYSTPSTFNLVLVCGDIVNLRSGFAEGEDNDAGRVAFKLETINDYVSNYYEIMNKKPNAHFLPQTYGILSLEDSFKIGRAHV